MITNVTRLRLSSDIQTLDPKLASPLSSVACVSPAHIGIPKLQSHFVVRGGSWIVGLALPSSRIDDIINKQQNTQTLSMDLHVIFPCCNCERVASPTGYRCRTPSSRLLHGAILVFVTEAQISDLFLWRWQIHWHFQRVACRERFSKSKTAVITSPILQTDKQTQIVWEKHGGSSNDIMTHQELSWKDWRI